MVPSIDIHCMVVLMLKIKDRQKDRQTDRKTDKQTDRQTERQTDRKTNRQTDRQTDRQQTRTLSPTNYLTYSLHTAKLMLRHISQLLPNQIRRRCTVHCVQPPIPQKLKQPRCTTITHNQIVKQVANQHTQQTIVTLNTPQQNKSLVVTQCSSWVHQ